MAKKKKVKVEKEVVVKYKPIPPVLHGFKCIMCANKFEAEKNDSPCPKCQGFSNRIR